jgi:hypothetical protein
MASRKPLHSEFHLLDKEQYILPCDSINDFDQVAQSCQQTMGGSGVANPTLSNLANFARATANFSEAVPSFGHAADLFQSLSWCVDPTPEMGVRTTAWPSIETVSSMKQTVDPDPNPALFNPELEIPGFSDPEKQGMDFEWCLRKSWNLSQTWKI